ncbi:hypothetical protein D3C87_1840140 [compost metagenome]
MRPFHHQQVVLRGDIQFAFGETGDGNCDAVVVFVYQLNVVWRVTVTLALVIFYMVEQAIETNG